MAELLSMAMAVDDDMKDESVSPLDLNSIGSNESGDVLSPSPEDIAWADSCLINDLAISDHGMDSLKHALLDSLPSQTFFSSVMRDDSPQESRSFPAIEETGISGIVDAASYDVSPTNEQRNTTRDQIYNKNRDSFWSRTNSKNFFSPSYNEDLGLLEASDSDVDSEFSTFVEENLDDYIFKVWELDIPDDEYDIVKQLNKALAESSLDSTPSASENLLVLDDKLLADIISGLDDLSLSPTTD
ncbi:hypothetical protein HAX54_052472 [Datura stramonium]|uniref:Uncharacterized protein n=1 Tax=Datura stramonium TaxID=4076 RepID=A0ABS8SZ06_DATST|nr:hypothetical protein [Datura stramonium]